MEEARHLGDAVSPNCFECDRGQFCHRHANEEADRMIDEYLAARPKGERVRMVPETSLAAAEARATAAEEALARAKSKCVVCGVPFGAHGSEPLEPCACARCAGAVEALAEAVAALEQVDEQLSLWEPSKVRAVELIVLVRAALAAARRNP